MWQLEIYLGHIKLGKIFTPDNAANNAFTEFFGSGWMSTLAGLFMVTL